MTRDLSPRGLWGEPWPVTQPIVVDPATAEAMRPYFDGTVSEERVTALSDALHRDEPACWCGHRWDEHVNEGYCQKAECPCTFYDPPDVDTDEPRGDNPSL